MKSAILYSALKPLTPQHRFVQSTMRVASPTGGNGPEDRSGNFVDPVLPGECSKYAGIYIRMEVVDGDELEALDQASPMEGETVLNSIPLG